MIDRTLEDGLLCKAEGIDSTMLKVVEEIEVEEKIKSGDRRWQKLQNEERCNSSKMSYGWKEEHEQEEIGKGYI